MENGLGNSFASSFSMTSLEKVLKNGANSMEITGNVNEVTKKRREVIVRGVLSVTVISAEDLPVVDLMGKADPFVTLTMKKSEMRNKTRVRASFQTMNNFFFFFLNCCLSCDFFINLAFPPLVFSVPYAFFMVKETLEEGDFIYLCTSTSCS
jgi:mannitol-specific phosphotransferase system IIBC component